MLDPIPALNASEFGERQPTNISDDVRSNPETFSMVTSQRRGDHDNPIQAISPYLGEYSQEIYKSNKKNPVNQPPNVPGLTFIRTVNQPFANFFDYENHRSIETSSRYVNGDANEINKLAEKAAMQMNNQTSSKNL